jgi:hypothetical protein
MQMFLRILNDERFQDYAIFSNESTIHVSGKVNTHNCRIWGSENPHVFLEHVVTAITHIMYLNMLQQFLIPQLDEDDQEGRIHFWQDGAPPITLEKCGRT